MRKLDTTSRACAFALLSALACSAGASGAVTIDDGEAADRAAVTRFMDEPLRSSNLRLKVIFGSSPDESANANARTTRLPIDVLAEQSRGSTDPIVLALLTGTCGNDRFRPKPTCDALEIANRWTMADTQNQLAWVSLAMVLQSRGAVTEARAAFVRAAEASMWREYYDDGVRTVARTVPLSLSPRARLAALLVAGSIDGGKLIAFGPASTISNFCKDSGLRDPCIRIIDTIARDGGTLFSSQLANRIAARMGMDSQIVGSRQRGLDALRWTSMNALPGFDTPDDRELPAAMAEFERRIELGEMRWMQARLTESGMSTEDAAAHYRDYVTAARAQAEAANAKTAP